MANDLSMATLELNAMNLPRTKGTSKKGLQNLRGALGAFTRFYANVQTDWEIKAAKQTSSDRRKTLIEVNSDLSQVYKENSV